MGKKLTQAPLFLAIAEVRFNAILSIEEYVPKIQDKLRQQDYPDYVPLEVRSFTFNGHEPATPTAITKHVFLSMDKRAGFVLSPSNLSFHTSKYEVFETFERDLMDGLRVIHDILNLKYWDRIGMRYLDAVLPRGGDTIDQYLRTEMMGLGGRLAGELDHSFTQTRTRLSKGALLVRCVIRKGSVGVPQDIHSFGLEIGPRFSQFDGMHAIVDTDASLEDRQPFALSEIRKCVYSLHKELGTAFRAIVTDYALDVWE